MEDASSTDQLQPATQTDGIEEQPDNNSSPGDTRIKLKYLDDTQKMDAAWLSQTVGEFKRQHFAPVVDEGKAVRLIYRGQMLRDESRSLASYGLHDNCIVHCHVSNVPLPSAAAGGGGSPQNQSRILLAGGIGRNNNAQGSTPATPNANNNTNNDNQQALRLGRFIYLIFFVKFSLVWFGFIMYPEYFDFASFFTLVLGTAVYVLLTYTNYRTARVQVQLGRQQGNNDNSGRTSTDGGSLVAQQ